MVWSRGTCSPSRLSTSGSSSLCQTEGSVCIPSSRLGAEGDFGWSSWLLQWPGRRSDVSSCLWRRWGATCPDSPPLEPGRQPGRPAATAPGGRAPLEASGLGRSSGAGRWSPGPPGSHPGSNPWGSWSLAGRCSGRSPPRFRRGRERRRSAARTSPRPGSTGRRSATLGLRGPAPGRRTRGCPAGGGCSGNCWAGQHLRSLWVWPPSGRWSCGQPAGSQAGKEMTVWAARPLNTYSL